MAFRPTQRNRDLGKALRNARKDAGLNQDEVAELLAGISQAKVSRYESGQRELAPEDRNALLALYQPQQLLRAEIDRLSAVTDAGAADDESPSREFMKLQEAEKDATEIRTSSCECIPRELQCDQYTLLQYRMAGRSTSETQVLRGKRERERLLSRSAPPLYFQLLSESSLYRVPGGTPKLMREQAQYLLQQLEKYPQLSLQVVPFRTNIGHVDNMTLLKFAGRRGKMVYLPNGNYGQLIKKPEVVAERTQRWEIMREAALSSENSAKFLYDLARNGPQWVTD